MATGFVSVPVVPTFKGMSKEFAERLEKPARQSGERAGKAISGGLDGAVANLEKQVKASSAKLETLDRAHQKSVSKREQQQDKLEASTLRLEDAENKYKAAVEAGDSGLKELARVKDEKAKVKKATDDLRQAEIDVTVAEKKHKDQLDDLNQTSGKYEKAQADLNDEVGKSKGIFERFRGEVVETGDDLDATAEKSAGFGDKLMEGLGKIGTGALLGIGAKIGTTVMGGISETMSKGWNTALSIDQVSRSLSAMTSETEVAEQMMIDLREVASDRPIDYTSFLEGANTLAYMGYEGDQAIQVMDNVGRAAVGAGRDGDEAMQRVIGALGTMQANGKVTANEIGQISSTGVPMLGALIDHFGMAEGSFEELSGMISEGKVDLEDVIAALEEAGGKDFENLHNSFENVNESLENQLAMLKDDVFTGVAEALQPILQEMDFEAIADKVGDFVGRIVEFLPSLVDFGLVAAEKLGELFEWIGKVVDKGEGLVDWAKEYQDYLIPLAVGIGSVATAFTVWTAAVKGYNTAIQIGTKVTKIFDSVTKKSIWGAIALAVIGVVSALTWFFTQTETGQEMWETFTSCIADAWDWVVEKLGAGWDWIRDNVFDPLMDFVTGTLQPIWESVVGFLADSWDRLVTVIGWAWENVFQPVFNGIWKVVQVTLAVIATTVLTPLMLAWNLLSSAIQWAWENIIQPVWDAIATFATETLWPILQTAFGWIGEKWTQLTDGIAWAWENLLKPAWDAVSDAATWLWENVLQIVFDFIGDSWDRLVTSVAWAWENILKPAWDALSSVASWMWEHVLLPVFGFIQDRWEVLSRRLQWAWENIIRPAWDALGGALTWLYENVVQPTLKWISDRWDDMSNALQRGWQWISDNVFDPLGRGLDTVKGWFQTGVDNITSIWDGLKKKLADPINWVINFVYNDGIKRVFDGVAEKVGLDARLPKVPEIKFATGGMMPGYTPGRDVHRFFSPTGGILDLSGGEPVMRPEFGRVVGKDWVDRMNYVARTKGERGVEREMMTSHFKTGGRYQAHASGGFMNLAGALSGVQQSHADFVARFFPDMFALTSATRFTDSGHHSTGKATDWQAQDGQYASQMPTPWSKALANAIYTNFPNSAELIHWPLDGWQNLSNGSPYDFGPGTNADHGNHVHWATQNALRWEDGNIVLDDVPGTGGSRFNPLNWFQGLADRVLGAIPSFDMDGFGAWGEVPGAALKTLGTFVKDWAMEKLTAFADTIKGWFGSGDVESYRPLVESILREKGLPESLADNTLRRMDQESTGDPRAQNNWDSNAIAGWPTKGLMQMRDDTFATHADPGYNDIWDPESNIRSSMNYAIAQYGSLPAAYDRAGGYALGGIIDLPDLFTRDLGGIVPSGSLVRNTSGRDELMLPPETTALMNRFLEEFPEVARALESGMVAVENAATALEAAADFQSDEGITARQSARRVLDLGLDLPGSTVITAVLDGEEALWDSRSRHLGHLDTLAEKETALEEARKALAELESAEGGLSKDEQRKLDDAQKAVDDAKAAQAEASADKQSAAAEKVADAEEKLLRVREDLDESATQNAEKHAEDLVSANDSVVKAEQDLVDARKAQVADLDHIVLASQDSIMGMIPQVEGLASQIIGMGAPVGAVNQGLGSVIGALTSVAGMAGPAGITLGMAFDAVKIGIQLVTTVIDAIEELIEKINTARMAAVQGMADGWAVIAEYAGLVVDMQRNVSSLQQEIVRGLNEQRTAEFNLRVANQDRLIAQAEGELAVAEARLALDKEIERGNIAAQLRLMGLHEDWDSYLSYQALAANGMLNEWSDAAIGALFTYEAARAQALQGELQARVDQINAESQLAAATRQNVRNQQDLLTAQERLIRMSAEVAGIDLVDATATSQVADIVVQMAELQQKMDSNWAGKAGAFLGTSGPWSNEYRGQQAQMESFRKTLDTILAETGVAVSDSQISQAIDQMKWVSGTGGDPMSVLRAIMPDLVDAETALRINDAMGPIDEARDAQRDAERDVEDFLADIDLFDKVNPLEETIKGLDYTIKGLEDAANAWAKGNEDLRGEWLNSAKANADAAKNLGVDWQLDGEYATPAVRDQIKREVTINWNGPGSEEDIQKVVDEILAGSDTRAVVKKQSSSTVAKSKREVRI